MNAVILLAALIGATLIIVRSTVMRRVRAIWPALLGCSQCTGTWIGAVAGVSGIERTVAFITNFAQFKPAILDKLNGKNWREIKRGILAILNA